MGRILDIGRKILNDWCEDRIKVGCYLRRGTGNGRHDGATRIVGLMNLGQHIENRCSRMLQKQCRGIGWKIFVVDFFFDKIYDGFVEPSLMFPDDSPRDFKHFHSSLGFPIFSLSLSVIKDFFFLLIKLCTRFRAFLEFM